VQYVYATPPQHGTSTCRSGPKSLNVGSHHG
jgi:hypothetical protein